MTCAAISSSASYLHFALVFDQDVDRCDSKCVWFVRAWTSITAWSDFHDKAAPGRYVYWPKRLNHVPWRLWLPGPGSALLLNYGQIGTPVSVL